MKRPDASNSASRRKRFGRLFYYASLWYLLAWLFVAWDVGHAANFPQPARWGIGLAFTALFVFLVSKLVPPKNKTAVSLLAALICALTAFIYPGLVQRGTASSSRSDFSQTGKNCASLVARYLLAPGRSGPLFFLSYLGTALDDVCRVQRAAESIKYRFDLICADLDDPRPVSCFCKTMAEISETTPLTVAGNVMELSTAIEVAKQESSVFKRESGSSGEATLRAALRLLEIVERVLIDQQHMLSPSRLPGYQQHSSGVTQTLVFTADNMARRLYLKALPIHVIRVLNQVNDEIVANLSKVTEDKQHDYSDRYKAQRTKVEVLLASVPRQ